MSYFVTITFDLRDAARSRNGTAVYGMITRDLDSLDYSKVVKGKKRTMVQLPSNTYVAEFDDDVEHQSEIADFVISQLKQIFQKYQVKGKYFVSTGRNWYWKVGTF